MYGGYNTGLMRFDRAGAPFVGGAAAAAGLGVVLRQPLLLAPGLALGLFFAFFFRDPRRTVTAEPDAVVAPADGRVLVAGPADREPEHAPPGDWQQLSIFLSPLDVHVNRVPIGGRITRVDRVPGRFLPAYRPDAARLNERTEIWIDRDGHTIVCRQVVGVLARRIVCRVRVGDAVATGQRYGIMKFGSRIDLLLPADAALEVGVGARVRGGETIVARLRRAEGAPA